MAINLFAYLLQKTRSFTHLIIDKLQIMYISGGYYGKSKNDEQNNNTDSAVFNIAN